MIEFPKGVPRFWFSQYLDTPTHGEGAWLTEVASSLLLILASSESCFRLRKYPFLQSWTNQGKIRVPQILVHPNLDTPTVTGHGWLRLPVCWSHRLLPTLSCSSCRVEDVAYLDELQKTLDMFPVYMKAYVAFFNLFHFWIWMLLRFDFVRDFERVTVWKQQLQPLFWFDQANNILQQEMFRSCTKFCFSKRPIKRNELGNLTSSLRN